MKVAGILLTFVVFFTVLTTPVFAQTTVTCGDTISSPGDYVINADVTDYPSTCITINSDNVNLDCRGHIIDGPGLVLSFGVYSDGYDNLVIDNCVFQELDEAIQIFSADGVTIQNSQIIDNFDGVYMYDVTNVLFQGNVVKDHGLFYGVKVHFGKHLDFRNNGFVNNDRSHTGRYEAALSLYSTCDVTVGANNNFNGNYRGIRIDNWNDYDTDGWPYPLDDCTFGHVIENNNFDDNVVKGIILFMIMNRFEDMETVIRYNTFTNHQMGAVFIEDNDNVVKMHDNTFTNNLWYCVAALGAGNRFHGDGIYAKGNNLEFYDNVCTGPASYTSGDHCIYVTHSAGASNNNYFHGNTLSSCAAGIFFNGNYEGENNIVEGNTITNTNTGVYVTNSEGVTITQNQLYGNNFGLGLLGDNNVIVYLNDIYFNSQYGVAGDSYSRELSYGGEGNYWGHATPPCFVPGVDSQSVNVVDSYATCDIVSSCGNEGDPCEDGNECTINDVCTGGVCVGTIDFRRSCDDGNECTDSDICDASGFCNGIDLTGTPCTADSDICTDDVCSFGACTHIPNTGNPCDDGNECTNPDACDMGTCDGSDLTGTPCTPDSIVCTDDICSSGSCIHPPNTGNSCNDGVSCTNPDTCDAGVCQGPTDPSLCTDRLDCSTIQCTIERCEYSGCVSTPPGIVLWLPFDGHMDDYSEKRNHGYCMYCPGDTSGHIDGAYNFDGSDDYISVNNDPTLNPNEFTVAAWIYIDILPGSTDWYGIVSKGDYTSGNGYELYVRSSTVANANEITFGLGPDRAYSGFIPSTGEWIHVAGTYNGSYMVLYVNGERRDTVSSGIIPNGGPLFVGRRTSSLSNLFDGRIDDVRVYEIALDDQDIFNLYGGVVTCNDYDANSDGAINIIDLAMVIFAQGRNNIDPYWHAYDHMDVTGDNKINLADINNIISRMGQVC